MSDDAHLDPVLYVAVGPRGWHTGAQLEGAQQRGVQSALLRLRAVPAVCGGGCRDHHLVPADTDHQSTTVWTRGRHLRVSGWVGGYLALLLRPSLLTPACLFIITPAESPQPRTSPSS